MSSLSHLTAAQLRSRRDRLIAAEESVMVGERVAKVSYDGGAVEYSAGATVEQLQRAIRETEVFLAKAEGRRSGGAIVPVFAG